jgi:hypothetical protein
MFRNRNGLLAPEFDSALPTSQSIARHGPEQDTYLLLEDVGQLGRAWRETDKVRIVAFNTAEGWSVIT